MDPETPREGLTASARRTAELLLRTLHNRAELFGLEIEEEGHWLVAAFVWTAALIFFAVLAITIVTITIAMLVTDEAARRWVLVGFSVVYLFLAVSALAGLKKHIKSRRPPMSDTVNELRKDLEWIQPRD